MTDEHSPRLETTPRLPPLAGQGPVGADRTGCQGPLGRGRPSKKPTRQDERISAKHTEHLHPLRGVVKKLKRISYGQVRSPPSLTLSIF